MLSGFISFKLLSTNQIALDKCKPIELELSLANPGRFLRGVDFIIIPYLLYVVGQIG